MKNSKRLVNALLVLGLAAATPLAFAQAAPPTDAAPQPEAQPAESAADAGKELSWADLDADGNGSLSKPEAQRHAGLANVFAQADADANSELTADEYRAYLQKREAGAAQE
jgi:hypothetical protein